MSDTSARGRQPGCGRIGRLGLLLTIGVLGACSDDGNSIVDIPDDGSDTDSFTWDGPLLAWPMPGTDGEDWTINNYVDLDPSAGLRDYRGGTKVYDGHRGIDLDVPNFRAMDDGFPILAAADGEVTSLHDGEFDRNTSCTGDWNYVTVTHANGSRAIYGHLRNGSVAVTVGQAVAAGDTLGVVGSSGCSTQPHLHFELLGADNRVISPFLRELWIDPPPYDPPLTFMDANLKSGGITGVAELKDPPADATVVPSGGTLGVGLSMAGGGPGDRIELIVRDGADDQVHNPFLVFDRVWRHTYWYWNLNAAGATGTWTIDVMVNDSTVATRQVEVG